MTGNHRSEPNLACDVLGVPHTATMAEITAAYRALAQAEHPDKGGRNERMREINLAYQALARPSTPATLPPEPLKTANPLLAAIADLIAQRTRHELPRIRADIVGHLRSGTRGDWHEPLRYVDFLLSLELDQFEAHVSALRRARGLPV